MNKKKAIKIATASVMAASAFSAVAPFTTEAAVNVSASVTKATTQMKKAQDTYTAAAAKGQVASASSVQKQVDLAKKYYDDAKKVIAKSGGKNKAAYTKKLNAALPYYNNAKNYIKAVQYADALKAQAAKYEAAAKAGKVDAVAYAKFSAELAKADQTVKDLVKGGTAERAVIAKYLAPAKKSAAAVNAYFQSVKAVSAINDITVDELSASVELPKTVEVTLVNGKKAQKEVKWDTKGLDLNKPDTYTLTGDVAGTNLTASVKVVVKEVAPVVTSVKAVNLKQVVVTFNKDVDTTTAGTTGNYTFATGSGVSVTAADVNGKNVTLTVSRASQQQSADLTVDGVKAVDGTVIAKATQSVKFVDAVAPTVTSVDAIGPKTIKVKFSEPLQSAPTFSLNDGTIAIVSTSFNAGDSEATLTLGTAPASGTYNLKVKDGLDYAGFKIDEVVKSFNFAVDTVAPVLTVKSASPTQIVLSSNEDLTGVLDNNVEFFHTYNGVTAYKANKSVNGKEITLTFANPLPEGAFKLFLNYADDKATQIADLWGNKVAEQTITGSVVSDTIAPTVTKVEASSNTAIEVTYSEAVTGATTAANYEIKDAAGNVVPVNGTITNVSGNKYSIPVGALNGGSYTLTIKNLKDTSINQNKLADYSTTVSVKDVVAPTVTDLDTNVLGTQAQLLSNKKVKIVFSEVMDKASIENKLNYLFDGVALDSKVTATAVDGNKAVVLDFTDVASGAQTTPQGAPLQVLRVADAAGNPTTTASTNVLVPGTVTAPLFDKAEATGKNTIKLYFKELITAAQATDFLVSVGGGAYNTVGSVTNDVVDGKSVLTVTTADDIDTAVTNVKVKTAASNVSAKNSLGTPVSLSATTVADKYAPVATTATAVETDGDNFVNQFVVTFSENLYAASVQDADFTVEGYEVTGVSVATNTVTITVKEKTSNDLAATPKVTLVGTVEDTARNARTGQDALTAVAAQGAVDLANAQTALSNAIDSAQTLHDGAVEGTSVGEYAVGSKATLQSAINSAQAVLVNPASTKAQIDTAKSDLDNAVQAFENGQVPAV